MTVEALVKNTGFGVSAIPSPTREVSGVYIGDLLSWVMGRAKPHDAWLTIMTNVNVVAVASLTDAACVILCEGTSLDEETLKKAEEKEINVLTTPLTAYEAALKIAKAIR